MWLDVVLAHPVPLRSRGRLDLHTGDGWLSSIVDRDLRGVGVGTTVNSTAV